MDFLLEISVVALASLVLAEDLLFIESLQVQEYVQATTILRYTVKVITEAEWTSMTMVDFAAFKAIIVADPYRGSLPSVDFLDSTKDV